MWLLKRLTDTAVAASRMGKTLDFVLFCLHMTNPYSWEILQLLYVSSLIYTEDTPGKMPEVCQKKLLIIKGMVCPESRD